MSMDFQKQDSGDTGLHHRGDSLRPRVSSITPTLSTSKLALPGPFRQETDNGARPQWASIRFHRFRSVHGQGRYSSSPRAGPNCTVAVKGSKLQKWIQGPRKGVLHGKDNLGWPCRDRGKQVPELKQLETRVPPRARGQSPGSGDTEKATPGRTPPSPAPAGVRINQASAHLAPGSRHASQRLREAARGALPRDLGPEPRTVPQTCDSRRRTVGPCWE